MPGVGAFIAMAAQILVIHRLANAGEFGLEAFRIKAVITLVSVKAAFLDPRANGAFGRKAEALHPLHIGFHMGLADEVHAHAQRAEVIAQRHLADLQRKAVHMRAVAVAVATGVETHARAAADRRLHIEPVEPHALGRQRVDVGGM